MRSAKLTLMCGLICLFSSNAYASRVTLSADDVNTAADIEKAIEVATNSGTEFGIVILDGLLGEFAYETGSDRSINVYFSNIVLMGVNGATISNCEDGVFFAGGADLSGIAVINLSFICSTGGIREGGPEGLKERIRIVDNHFDTGTVGIVLSRLRESVIARNTVSTAGQAVVVASESEHSVVMLNHLTGFRGVNLLNATDIRISHNYIDVEETGVLLQGASSLNKIVDNIIYVETFPGISLLQDTYENKVLANGAEGSGNLWIEDLGTDNWIR